MRLHTYDNTEHFITSMIGKGDDKSAVELFRTYFTGCIIPDFEAEYGVKLKYNENFEKMLGDLKKIKGKIATNL